MVNIFHGGPVSDPVQNAKCEMMETGKGPEVDIIERPKKSCKWEFCEKLSLKGADVDDEPGIWI